MRSSLLPAILTLLHCCALLVCGEESHWAFKPVQPAALPALEKLSLGVNPIDSFLHARLAKAGLTPSPPADRITLIRRVTIDLIGLPPTLNEIDEFLRDDRPDAYPRLVERLLASPHYGERWARVWLDLCHYGDSDGHLTDQLRPVAWRYRDWVMRALNENLPFDAFTIAQLAGDVVNSQDVQSVADPMWPTAKSEQILGTGFLRQTLSNREGGADLEEYRVEQIVDRTSLCGTIWLGLTVGCARCHDHKYDPLTQEEFFRLYAFFDRADEINIDAPLPWERAAYARVRPEYERRRKLIIEPFQVELQELQQRWEQKCLHAASHPGEDHVWDRQWELLGLIWGGGFGEGQLEGTEIVKLAWDNRTSRQQGDLLDYFLQHGSIVDEKRFAELKLGELRQQLADLRKELPQSFPTRAPVMHVAATVRQTFVHESGDFRSPGAIVEAATPRWLLQNALSPPEPDPKSRLALARWLVSPDQPLTSRVTVNRMWQEFFGRGLVVPANDFGRRGTPPSHPELLDWLASEFMRSRWDVKHIHRLIVNSDAYRQSSQPQPEMVARDPENVLVARQVGVRVPAETLRDLGLAVSGLLTTKLGGPSVFPPQHERVTMEAFGSNSWKTSEGSDRYRRGLYTFILRTSPFAQSITFDAPNPQQACTRRDRSNTPMQALTLLNDPVFVEMSEALANRIIHEGGAGDSDRIQFAWRLCLGRPPNQTELKRLIQYLDQLRAGNQPPPSSEQAVWANFASVLLNLHEFITRD